MNEFPKSGQFYKAAPDGEIRVLLYGHYRIAYQLAPPDTVLVLGVFHGALDIERHL